MSIADDLFIACTIGDLAWTKSCLEQEGNNLLTAIDKNGMNCLQLAALNAHPKTIEYILTYGLSPRTLVEETKENSFHLVVSKKHNNKGVRSLQLLISALPTSLIVSTLNQRDSQGQTPLHKATITGNIFSIKLLLKHGARSDIRDQSGYLPMDLAKNNCHYEVARLLKSHLWSLEKNKRQYYMLLNKNKELLEEQERARSELEKRREVSEFAYLQWLSCKKTPFNITQSKLHFHFGPTNVQTNSLDKSFNSSMKKEIVISLKQEKRNLDIYKHTQHLPAPLIIKSATPKYRKKVWIPQAATHSTPISRLSERDISNELCDRFTNHNTLHSLTGSEIKIECYVELASRPKSRNSTHEQEENRRCRSLQKKDRPHRSVSPIRLNLFKHLKISPIQDTHHGKTPIPIQNFAFPVSQVLHSSPSNSNNLTRSSLS